MSPNTGLIGAPHAGHLSSWAPAGAIDGPPAGAGAEAGCGGPPVEAMEAPHFAQNFASSGSDVPHFVQ
jgi:hypothetical protein